MATSTTYLLLIKPEATDTTKIREDMNANSDLIDAQFASTYLAPQAKNSVTITGGSITGITDLVVADGGTGVSTLTDGGVLLGSGTGAITAMAVLTDGQMIVGNGTTDPVAESGATLRTSIGVAIGTNVQAYDGTLAALAGLTITTSSLIYGTGTDAFNILACNSTATNKFLRSVSSGAPSWQTLASGDIPDISATYSPVAGSGSIVTIGTVTSGTLSTGAVLADVTMTLGSDANNDIYYRSSNKLTRLAIGASGTYLKSNGATSAPTFSVPAGAGDVAKVGTPADSQIGVWTGDGTIEGHSSLTYDRSNLQLTGDIGSTGTPITKGWFTDLYVANDIAGSITGNAETVTFADNNATNENNEILFAGNAAASGDAVVEADSDFHYNPSTGTLTAPFLKVYRVSESTALNAGWLQITSSVVTGDLTGLRTVMSTDAISGGGAASGVNVRGVYGQATAEASAHAGLLQGGLFTASAAAGTVYNVHVLCGHYSSGGATTIGGDLYVGYLRAQTRQSGRNVTGNDCLLALENEAISGTGQVMNSAIRIFDTNMGVDGFTYGIDMSSADITTADIILQNGETISNTTDGVVAISGTLALSTNNITMTGSLAATGARVTKGWFTNLECTNVITINGSALSSSNLSDVTSIAMLDETETVTVGWTFTANPGINKTSDTASAKAYVAFRKRRVTNDDVASGDYLGASLFYGYHGSAYALGASIRAIVDGTPGDVTDMPTKLEFLTSADGSATPTLRLTINAAGLATFAGAVDMSSLTLDTALAIAEGGTGVTTGAMTGITSVLNAGLYVGRDADNTINFATDNVIIFQTNGAEAARFGSTGELDMGNNTVGFTQQTVTYNGTTTTVDWKLGNKAIMTFGAGNITTFAFTNPTNPCNLLLKIVQDGSGSRTVTNWDTDIKYPDGTDPTLSTGANAVDIISFYWDGTNYHGVITKAFSVPA